MNAADAFGEVVERAVEAGLRKALAISEVTNRRLLTVEQTAVYLALSRREVYNMLNSEFPAVKRGKRTMIDIRDVDNWIERSKG